MRENMIFGSQSNNVFAAVAPAHASWQDVMPLKVSGLDGLFCETVADKFSVDACIIHVAAMPVR